jgi:hypothetical protein
MADTVHEHDTSSHEREMHACGARTSTAPAPIVRLGRTYKVRGLDCAEEVAEGFTAISHYFVMDWASVWIDIVGGLLIAVGSDNGMLSEVIRFPPDATT